MTNDPTLECLSELPEVLLNERGMPGSGVAIWRLGEPIHYIKDTVASFLLTTENQSDTWLIDGGWGGPPGPIHVEWIGDKWVNRGFCGLALGGR